MGRCASNATDAIQENSGQVVMQGAAQGAIQGSNLDDIPIPDPSGMNNFKLKRPAPLSGTLPRASKTEMTDTVKHMLVDRCSMLRWPVIF